LRRHISFNACDQLWNADRLGQKGMPLDLQPGLVSALNELEVSVAWAPTSIAPRLSYQQSNGDSHQVIPRLLATCCLRHPEGLKHVGRQTSADIKVVGDLIFRNSVTGSRTEKAIDWAVVVAQSSELRLHGLDRGISHRYSVINGLGVVVIVLRNVSDGVIIRIIIVGVIRQVVPWKESGI